MMRKTPIYLDNNATTPLRAAAIYGHAGCDGAASKPVIGSWLWTQCPSALLKRRAVRWQCLPDAAPADVVFTSGGTEANNLVMAQYDHVITSKDRT